MGTILHKEKDYDFALVQFQDPFRSVQNFVKHSSQPKNFKIKESIVQIKAKMITIF